MWNCNNPYAYRDANLKTLGFASYRDYLKSDLWALIRRRAVKGAKSKCQRCGSGKRIQVHHRAYDIKTLAGASLDSLSVVCRVCHCAAERPGDFSRTRYERLTQASEYVLAAPSTDERIRRWSGTWGDELGVGDVDTHEAVHRVAQQALRHANKGRCVVCGMPERLRAHDPVQWRWSVGSVCVSRRCRMRLRGVLAAVGWVERLDAERPRNETPVYADPHGHDSSPLAAQWPVPALRRPAEGERA